MTKNTLEKRTRKHRAVAPVIATLLMVAIAVVGGTIIFVFSQGFFSQSQISGTPTIEAVKISGYDARDVAELQSHTGTNMLSTGSGGDGDGTPEVHERVVVYIKNDSVQKIQFSEIRFGGVVYNYTSVTSPLDAPGAASKIAGGEYGLWLSDDGTSDVFLTVGQAEVQPGQIGSLVLGLDSNFKIGRDTQFKMTTTNGAVFVGTVVIGQQAG